MKIHTIAAPPVVSDDGTPNPFQKDGPKMVIEIPVEFCPAWALAEVVGWAVVRGALRAPVAVAILPDDETGEHRAMRITIDTKDVDDPMGFIHDLSRELQNRENELFAQMLEEGA